MSFDSRKTPYYLINIEKLIGNYRSFRNAIESLERNDIIAYSVKANYNPAIIEQLNCLGSYFEVCSEYEYKLILNHGIKASHIIINGCFFNASSNYGESMLILDTYHQLAEWAKKGCRQKIGIRVNLDYITVDDRFRNKKSRFGISFNDQKVIDLLNNVELKNVICLHCHLSGNNREPSIYRDVIIQLQNIRKTHRLNNVIFFDIGGGYKIGDARKSLEFLDYVNEINEVCPKDIQIIYEPGNSIVRNCAEYHTKIISVKNTGGECIFVADGSSLHIPKINYMQNDFHFETIGKKTRYSGSRVYGNTCKESDLLMKLDSNIELGVGDYLVLENVGAYSMNEISPLILGVPNTITKMKEKIILGDHVFCYVCKYSDCYNKNGRNNYSILKDNTSQKGLYAFVKNGNIIYIGVAYSQSIEKRVKQHFRKDSGGLRNKLSSQDIKDLEKSALYICQLGESKQNLLFEEAYLIGLYKPKLNYL